RKQGMAGRWKGWKGMVRRGAPPAACTSMQPPPLHFASDPGRTNGDDMTGRQTFGHSDRHSDGQTDRQTFGHSDRQTDRHSDIRTDRHSDRQTINKLSIDRSIHE
ncbi:hypothetical protein Vafri_8992, partial [Volvox africanus]